MCSFKYPNTDNIKKVTLQTSEMRATLDPSVQVTIQETK
jgi:hypothetical protein